MGAGWIWLVCLTGGFGKIVSIDSMLRTRRCPPLNSPVVVFRGLHSCRI